MAYSVLRDASLRRVYDAALMLSRREQDHPVQEELTVTELLDNLMEEDCTAACLDAAHGTLLSSFQCFWDCRCGDRSLAQASDHGSSGSSRARRSCCRFWADFSRSTRSWADGRSRSIREELRWCPTGRWVRASSVAQQPAAQADVEVRLTALWRLHGHLERLHQPFHQSVGLGVIWAASCMANSICLADIAKPLVDECWTVVRYEFWIRGPIIRIRNGHGSDHTLKHVLVVVPKAHMDAGSGLVEAFRLIKDAGSRWSSMLPDPMQLLSSRKTTSPGVLFRCSTQVSVKSRPVGSSTHSRDETPSMRAPSLVQVTLSDFLGFLCPSEPHTRFSSASPLSPTHTALKCSFAAIASYSESTTVSQVLSAATLSVVVDELIEVKLSRRHTSPKRNSAHEAFRLFRCTTPTLPRRNDRLDMKQLSREAEGRGICHTDSDKFRQSLLTTLCCAVLSPFTQSKAHRTARWVFVNGRTENATSSLLIDDTADGGNLLGSGPARAEATLEAQQQRVEAGGGISSHGPQCSEACKTRQRSVSIIFVDFRKAFDSVSRPAIAVPTAWSLMNLVFFFSGKARGFMSRWAEARLRADLFAFEVNIDIASQFLLQLAHDFCFASVRVDAQSAELVSRDLVQVQALLALLEPDFTVATLLEVVTLVLVRLTNRALHHVAFIVCNGAIRALIYAPLTHEFYAPFFSVILLYSAPYFSFLRFSLAAALAARSRRNSCLSSSVMLASCSRTTSESVEASLNTSESLLTWTSTPFASRTVLPLRFFLSPPAAAASAAFCSARRTRSPVGRFGHVQLADFAAFAVRYGDVTVT
uniref:Reverse transcriptase domain-containing protein n=1 Tax=Macrostomum lignano TaxID=282301 RepID=A0A1I8ISY3_9PLAT